MSITSTISAFNMPVGSAGSAFKIPSYPGTAAADHQVNSGMFSVLGMDSDPSVVTYNACDSSWNTYANSTVSNLSRNLSVLSSAQSMQDRIARVDALQAGNVKDGAATNPNLNANSTDCKSESPLSKGLGALKNGAKVVGNAINDVTNAMKDVFNSIVQGLKAAMGWAWETAKDVVAAFNAATADIKLAIQAAASGIAAGLGAAWDAAKSALSSIASSAKAALDALTTAATDAYNSALATIKGTNFFGFMNSDNPCIQDVLGDVINTDNIDKQAIALYQGA